MSRGIKRPALLAGLVLSVGCTTVDEQLSDLLREYLEVQDGYHREHGRYGDTEDLAGRGLEIPPEVILWVQWHGPTEHSAHARSAYLPEFMCVVFDGPRPPGLDYDRARVPVCGRASQFVRFTTTFLRPVERIERPIVRWARRLGTAGAALIAAYLLVFGLPRLAPWGYRVVYWTPAVLSTAVLALGFLVLGGSGGGGGTGTAPVGFFAVAILPVIPALMLNTMFFAVPRAIADAGKRFPWGVTVGASVGTLYYGGALVVLAGRNYRNDDFAVAAVFFALYLLAVVHIVLAHRRGHTERRGVAAAPEGDDWP